MVSEHISEDHLDEEGNPPPPAPHTHPLSEIPDSGTAAAEDVPASGNAAVGEVVKGDDTRLTDKRAPVDGATLNGYVKALLTINPATGTVAIDMAAANDADLTLTGATTLDPTNVPGSGKVELTLRIIQDGTGGHVLTFPANTKWDVGTPPTLNTDPNNITDLVLVTRDGGTNWTAYLVADEVA